MKTSTRAAVGGVLVLAATALVVTVAEPAWQRHKDRQWEAAGQRALTRIALPASFKEFRESTSGYLTLRCAEGTQRCFVAEGDPRSNVDAAQAALRPMSNAPLHRSCHTEPLAGTPDRCLVVVPVSGGQLTVALFARPVSEIRPKAHFSGTYVEVFVDSRR